MKNFNSFTNLYPIPKTLRFELIPNNEKTKEFIKKIKLIETDRKMADNYQQAKELLNNKHRAFIEAALNKPIEGLSEKITELEGLLNLLDGNKQPEKDKQSVEKCQDAARALIAKHLQKEAGYKKLFGKELIKELMEETKGSKEYEQIKDFEKFTTYFNGYNQNRANIYTKEKQATAIAYRIIHDNLPKFLSNKKIYEELKRDTMVFSESDIEKGLDSLLQGDTLEDIFNTDYFANCLNQRGIEKYNGIVGGLVTEGGEKIQGINEKINEYNQQQKKDSQGDKKEQAA